MNTIILTEGDPCGINYEILKKSLNYLKEKSKKNQIIHIRSQDQIFPEGFTNISAVDDLPQTSGLYSIYNFVDIGNLEETLILGQPSPYSGRVSFESLKKSIDLQKKHPKSKLCTLPLSKEWVIKSGRKDFIGHTEYLSQQYKLPTYMLMYGKEISILLLSTHIPLNEVSTYVGKVCVKSLIKAIENYIDFFKIKDLRIAFLGLNPHAGEGGLIGKEEKSILKKIFDSLYQEFSIEGFFSADSIFVDHLRKKFNFFIACYHDQGLIPFKIIEGKNGVNLTLGLDFLRVSPDHGTAFNIAKKDIADENSLLNCLELLTSF